ncbi:MAG: hypothetical protein KDK33_11865 [Leptospiraceae bacterium]|nr:hypothetical protein [Leptospiraceae bacterium]
MGLKQILKAYLGNSDRFTLPSPSESEMAVIAEARARIRKLPELTDSNNLSASDREWLENRKKIRNLILYSDPRIFLRWDIIRHTMFVTEAPFVRRELSDLRKAGISANDLKEDDIGSPEQLRKHPYTSANLVHHRYHIQQFESVAGHSIDDYSSIVEFGGGYGSLCRLALRKGFRGRYIIFDLPEFNVIQYIFLTLAGIPVAMEDSERPMAEESKAVMLFSSPRLLQTYLSTAGGPSLLIATWSLSETSLDFRSRFLRDAGEFEGYLIAFQKQFNEVDNEQFFHEFAKERPGLNWQSRPCRYLPENRYLFGGSRPD